MIPTYVFGWPSGQETGDFLAVDLGTPHLLILLSSPDSSLDIFNESYNNM